LAVASRLRKETIVAETERVRVGDDYVLATGDEGAARLDLLDEVYGPSTRRACEERGLSEGMRVADIGCGTGHVSCWFGERVGPAGAVTGLDVSADQLAVGHERAARRGLGNVSFVEGSAYEPGLPVGTFDLAFCRFLLCHLQRPADALAQMAALLRPGGVLVVQDMVMSAMFTDPPTHAYSRFVELAAQTGEALGVDYDVGRRLFGMFRDLGLTELSASVHQPAFASGARKRLWEHTFLEAAPSAVAAEIVAEEEFEDLVAEFAAIGEDDSTLVLQPPLLAVAGVSPGSRSGPGR
jgi:ubiquinone/menaquinone biosynthesis C-methylase UbiE